MICFAKKSISFYCLVFQIPMSNWLLRYDEMYMVNKLILSNPFDLISDFPFNNIVLSCITYFWKRKIQNMRYTLEIFKTFFKNIFLLRIKWYTTHVFGMITNPAYCLCWYVIFATATSDLKNEGNIIDHERLHTFVYIYSIRYSCYNILFQISASTSH